jgi:hypothetical protein
MRGARVGWQVNRSTSCRRRCCLSHQCSDGSYYKQPRHRLLDELAQALMAFRMALQKQSVWNDVLVMTYSEFGRRVEENASQEPITGRRRRISSWEARREAGCMARHPRWPICRTAI